MEKPVRICSIISIVITGTFFIVMFLGAGMGANGAEGKGYQFISVLANIFLFIAPIFFIITLTIGMMCILRRTMMNRTPGSIKPKEKYPVLFFSLACVFFVMFIFFVSAVMTAAG